jgi:pyruvate dehydrogenase kinase 2/3/4
MDDDRTNNQTSSSSSSNNKTGTSSSVKSNKDHSSDAPLAGLGYGLPISRDYCKYFGGELDIISMEGFGTDAFIHLKRLGDSIEPVPL